MASACLLPLGASYAATPAAPATAQAAMPAHAPDDDADAAARHAKRTACLKQAKDKKLVGAARNSFVKECVGAH